MAIIHLFVDTNVLLSFYSYADDDLTKLQALVDGISPDGICLHLPEQVVNELERNRETKLKAAADQFGKEGLNIAVPRHMQAYPQANEYVAAVQQVKTLRSTLISLAQADASNRTLKTDVLLRQLFEKANRYAENDGLFQRGLQRSQKGNPPGKNGSVGDQYNWEVLLEELPNEDLHIVSKDGDYSSLLNKSRPHPCLESEWRIKKNANLHIYNELGAFLTRYQETLAQINEPAAEIVPTPTEVQLPANEHVTVPIEVPLPVAELENTAKDAAILKLEQSASFATTHSAVALLSQFSELLTKADAERLLNAAINNAQVRWIATDSDVYSFFTTLILGHMDMDPALFVKAAEVFGFGPDAEDQDPLAD
jgi:hypothetical protein